MIPALQRQSVRPKYLQQYLLAVASLMLNYYNIRNASFLRPFKMLSFHLANPVERRKNSLNFMSVVRSHASFRGKHFWNGFFLLQSSSNTVIQQQMDETCS